MSAPRNAPEYDFTPHTRAVAATTLRKGDVVMESYEHPARITRIKHSNNGRVSVWCRFIWQARNEPEWKLGVFPRNAPIEKAVK